MDFLSCVIRAIEPFFACGLIDVSKRKKKDRNGKECAED
jgi:hypothetical protein